jgi:hypothetical protein
MRIARYFFFVFRFQCLYGLFILGILFILKIQYNEVIFRSIKLATPS